MVKRCLGILFDGNHCRCYRIVSFSFLQPLAFTCSTGFLFTIASGVTNY